MDGCWGAGGGAAAGPEGVGWEKAAAGGGGESDGARSPKAGSAGAGKDSQPHQGSPRLGGWGWGACHRKTRVSRLWDSSHPLPTLWGAIAPAWLKAENH